jgi:hypothetical protein
LTVIKNWNGDTTSITFLGLVVDLSGRKRERERERERRKKKKVRRRV